MHVDITCCTVASSNVSFLPLFKFSRFLYSLWSTNTTRSLFPRLFPHAFVTLTRILLPDVIVMNHIVQSF
eukprot:m.11524 g.11524  ORF g.11524 m.11524 type:complete len:70 (+) comp5738_c0_seq1:1326-1535(+)